MKFHELTLAISRGTLNQVSSEQLEEAKNTIQRERNEINEEIDFYGESEQRSDHLYELEKIEVKVFQELAGR